MSARRFYVQGTLLSLLMVALLVFTSLQAYGLLMAGSVAFWIGIVQVVVSLAGLVFIGGSTLRMAAKTPRRYEELNEQRRRKTMSNQYIRLETAPGLNHPGYPTCDACGLETRLDDGQWLCEGCGTAWSSDSMEHPPDAAMLYEEWSGEVITGPICPNEYAWRVSRLPPEERESWIKEYA